MKPFFKIFNAGTSEGVTKAWETRRAHTPGTSLAEVGTTLAKEGYFHTGFSDKGTGRLATTEHRWDHFSGKRAIVTALGGEPVHVDYQTPKLANGGPGSGVKGHTTERLASLVKKHGATVVKFHTGWKVKSPTNKHDLVKGELKKAGLIYGGSYGKSGSQHSFFSAPHEQEYSQSLAKKASGHAIAAHKDFLENGGPGSGVKGHISTRPTPADLGRFRQYSAGLMERPNKNFTVHHVQAIRKAIGHDRFDIQSVSNHPAGGVVARVHVRVRGGFDEKKFRVGGDNHGAEQVDITIPHGHGGPGGFWKEPRRFMNGGEGSGVRGHITPKELTARAEDFSRRSTENMGNADLHMEAAKAHHAASDSYRDANAVALRAPGDTSAERASNLKQLEAHETAAKFHNDQERKIRFQGLSKSPSNKPWWKGDKHLD